MTTLDVAREVAQPTQHALVLLRDAGDGGPSLVALGDLPGEQLDGCRVGVGSVPDDPCGYRGDIAHFDFA